jgi:hypothetical protein
MLKQYYIYFLIIIIHQSISTDFGTTSVVSTLVQHITNYDYYQIAIFLNRANNNVSNNYDLLEKISRNNPTIVIDMSKLQLQSADIYKSRHYIFKRKSTLLIIIQRTFNSDDVLRTLDFYIELLLKGMRPRCLIVISDRVSSKILIENNLYYAWKRKFLDVTVINVNIEEDKVNAEILNYNPFSETYNYEQYTSKTDIFPDKLRDLKRYDLRVPFINSEPDMFVERTINNVIEYDGSGFSIIKYVGYALNFHINVDTGFGSFVSAFNQLKNSNFNLMCFPLFITESLINEKLEIGKIHSFETYRAMIIPRTTLSMSVSFITFLPFALSVLVIFLGTYALNIARKHLRVFDILRLIFGQPALTPPKKVPERIVFITIAILSIIFLPTIIAKITGVIVSQQPPPIDSFKDAVNAKLQPYAFHGLLELLSNDDDKYASLITSNIILYNDTDFCLRLLLTSTEHTMCFTPETQAKMYANKYRKPDGSPMIKLTDLRVSLMAEALIYEEGSPFVEKFDQVVQLMVESGVWLLWGPKYLNLQSMDREGNTSVDNKDHVVSVQLLLMYISGCLFAFCTFIVELLVVHFQLRA